MEQEELPLGGIGVDFTQVEPIQHKRTLAFINQFVTHSAHFLNRFSFVCEEKLADISDRIQRLQVTATLLEMKLASIPGLESVHCPDYCNNLDASWKLEHDDDNNNARGCSKQSVINCTSTWRRRKRHVRHRERCSKRKCNDSRPGPSLQEILTDVEGRCTFGGH